MSRFDQEDDGFQEDEDLFPDIEEDEINLEYIKVLEQRELIEELKLRIVQKELNYSILRKSILYCQSAWFWRFKSFQTKLNLIINAYQTFKTLIDLDLTLIKEDEQEEEE